MLVQCTKGPLAVLALIALLPISSASAFAQTDPSAVQGYYTKSQADAGHAVFKQTCAICHGDQLQGGVGPALAGKEFLSVSQYQQITADYFYNFMSTHMPLTDPGSLTKTQYLDIMAYFLEANGYASGQNPLTANDEELKGIKIEPQH
ncbi:MAG TPA: cytochrome c [Acetobacteraceae bacterium]|nr:cytochrome c [Acetobacteraceae bacterium]